MDIITTHLNADFDALASMVAAKKYYPDAVLVFPGSQEKSVRDFLSTLQKGLDIRKIRSIEQDRISRLILVDVKNPARIGTFSGLLDKKGLVIHIYDHHPFTGSDIRGQEEIIEQVGATTTIFAEMLQKDRAALSPAEATIMLLGIYEETGSLTFTSTTPRDLTAAAYLLKKGGNLNIVSNFISRELSPDQIDLLNELIHTAKDILVHDTRVKIASASRENYIRDIAPLAHKMLDIEGIEQLDAVFLLVMMEDRIQLIARSNAPEVDVSEILHAFGGGGHAQAASAVVRELSLEEAEAKLLKTLKTKIHPVKTAKDIMTSPVKSIPWNQTVKTAEATMTKYEVNVLPVLKQEMLYGLISRESVEKAIFHGFGRSRVAEFCTTDTPTAEPSTSISVIESQMVEKNQRFMAVVENGRIVGAITRTDLLRSLYESLLKKNRIRTRDDLGEKTSTGKNLSSLMRSMFPRNVFNFLKLSGKTADDLGYKAYLVG
ncbi:MAG: CBS domain-containing protein, partial [Nitrospirota bacterium]|nr:CBS domain-containing protein [Nitrospirota bacterium]